eukprot:565591-Rhodomonas_salina.1
MVLAGWVGSCESASSSIHSPDFKSVLCISTTWSSDKMPGVTKHDGSINGYSSLWLNTTSCMHRMRWRRKE